MNKAATRRRIGQALVLAGPLLAGLGRAGGWSVGIFALIAVLGIVLSAPAETWRAPVHLAIAAVMAAAACAALYLAGGLLARAAGPAAWGGLGPLALSAAGAVLAGTGWFPVTGARDGR